MYNLASHNPGLDYWVPHLIDRDTEVWGQGGKLQVSLRPALALCVLSWEHPVPRIRSSPPDGQHCPHHHRH